MVSTLRKLVVSGLLLGQVAAAQHDHVEGARIAVSDGSTNVIRILAADSGAELGSFTVPGETGGSIAVSSSGGHVIATHREANRISIIHSGLLYEDHGDHGHLIQSTPYVVSTVNIGVQPSHVTVAGNEILVFNDGDGSIAILDENLFGLSLNYGFVDVAQPDHGAAQLLGDHLLAGLMNLARVDIHAPDGSLVTSIGECPGLHGSIATYDSALFGCSDGVLRIEFSDGDFSGSHMANPAGSPEGSRIGSFYGHVGDIAVGNFGSGLALIDTVTGYFNVLELPDPPLAAAVSSESVVALTADGSVHLLQVAEGEAGIIYTHEALINPDTTYGRPAIAVYGDRAWVSEPAAGNIVVLEIHGTELHVLDTFAVGGNPAGIGVLMLEGEFGHDH